MSKPIIGIPSPRTEGEILPHYAVTGDYIEQTERAGGIPVMLPMTPYTTLAQLEEWLDLCGGILLPGGGDLDCALYGQALLPGQTPCTEAGRCWQGCELELIRRAAEEDLPILGICLGAQAINVAFGGTLIQDIESQVPGCLSHRQPKEQRTAVTHSIAVKPGTLLAKASGIRGGGTLAVNTYHHQAVAEPAPGFHVSAVSEDGIIEAVENPKKNILGVQWHPENLSAEHPEAFSLFRWLVKKAD